VLRLIAGVRVEMIISSPALDNRGWAFVDFK
jgi:hypothetical protein